MLIFLCRNKDAVPKNRHTGNKLFAFYFVATIIFSAVFIAPPSNIFIYSNPKLN